MSHKRVSEERKIKEGRGTGHGKDYKPWIMIREFGSEGVRSAFPDWKHGRMIQCLSQAERNVYLKMRWDDRVTDIREQYPLDLEKTNDIARRLGFMPPDNGRTHMTTDFLVDINDGSHIAISVKKSRDVLKDARTKEKLTIEYYYWTEREIPFSVVFEEEALNPIEIRNIRDVIGCYKTTVTNDKIALLRHKIAHKEIIVDMTKEINYSELLDRYIEEK